MNPFEISYTWMALGGENSADYFYADPLPPRLNLDYAKPAIYRWALFRPELEHPCEVYIGETENLANRLKQYLKPGPTQWTNLRLKEHFVDEIGKGLRCELQLLKFEAFQINNVLVLESSIHNSSIRKMLEQFLIADHDSVTCALLNLKTNPIERRLRRAFEANAQRH